MSGCLGGRMLFECLSPNGSDRKQLELSGDPDLINVVTCHPSKSQCPSRNTVDCYVCTKKK